MHGMPDRDGMWVEGWWGGFLMEIGQGDHAEETADAYRWLASLYQKKTLKANRVTVQWIDEYLAKVGRALAGPLVKRKTQA